MKIAAIIAEYNPFHNGHQYQLNYIKETQNVDATIVVLSGAFTQRGIPGLVNQHLRAKMALLCGADVVFELPSYFSTGSAEYFSKGAVSLLDKLGVVDSLVFGSENGDVAVLTKLADKTNHLSKDEDLAIKELQSKGFSYSKARSLALNLDEATLDNPNNILGIEYIRELLRRNSNIKPNTIKRIGKGYSDETISSEGFSSAMAIRNALYNNEALEGIKDQVPACVFDIMQDSSLFNPVFLDDFSDFLLYQLHINRLKGYSDFYDVGEFLSNTFANRLQEYKSFSSFIELCKTKNFTYTRINRALTHIMLGMTQSFAIELSTRDYTGYARLLGFSKNGESVLSSIKANSSIPIISKASKASEILDDFSKKAFEQDLLVSHLYQSIYAKKYGLSFVNEYSQPVIIIK